MQEAVDRSWLLPRPPQEVWNYLTDPGLLSQWLMETDLRPFAGHPFRFTCGTVIDCEVLEAEPFTRLSYSWRTESIIGGGPFTSKVCWTLKPIGNGTELQLIHDGFPTPEDAVGHDGAWKMTVGKMAGMMDDRSFRTLIEIISSSGNGC